MMPALFFVIVYSIFKGKTCFLIPANLFRIKKKMALM